MTERCYAVIGPSWPFKGGIARYTTELYRALAGHSRALFISVSRQYPRWLYPGRGDRAPEDRGIFEPSAQPLLDPLNPLSWWRTASAVCAFRPDTVILPWWHLYWGPAFAGLAVLLRRRCPGLRIIFLCHNVVGHDGGRLARIASRLVLRRADAFLVHGESEERQLRALLGEVVCARVEHPAYAIDRAALPSRDEARKRLGVESAGPLLLFFGFVRPYKGLDLLLAALAELQRSQPCRLVVAGECWEPRATWEQRVRALGLQDAVYFHDRYIPEQEVATYFAACDAVVLPYRSATGSGVAKLAMSYGRAVIATRVGSLAAAIDEGVNGFSVASGDVAALAAAIRAILEGDRAGRMGHEAAESARRHGWDPVLAALEAL
ncbi:glycosyltransferase [Pseudohaliea sp.]|uniref:glycosyltransferase n=1 Tax=Pseudohaliea sp. TaxID=2740289 RepID=UPI0032EDDC0F